MSAPKSTRSWAARVAPLAALTAVGAGWAVSHQPSSPSVAELRSAAVSTGSSNPSQPAAVRTVAAAPASLKGRVQLPGERRASRRARRSADVPTPKYKADEIVITYDDHATAAQRRAVRRAVGSVGAERIDDGVEVLRLARRSSLSAAVRRAERTPGVKVAQRNALVQSFVTPNDPQFPSQWALNQASDADIDAPEAWDLSDTTTTPITVGVIDTGFDLSHPDLQNQYWTNPGENGPAGTLTDCNPNDGIAPVSNGSTSKSSNGYDDDCNGYVDDAKGWDFRDEDALPAPLTSAQTSGDIPHGTHVAGIVGAQRGNGIGVAGVSSQARIMPLKAWGPDGGTVADIRQAMSYAIDKGAKVINGSFGAYGLSAADVQLWTDAIQSAPGVLFVFAAGNDAISNEDIDAQPCNAPAANVICVGATDQFDALASFSNYGATQVDILAPGVDINSTVPGGGYGPLSGTSMSTPIVAGAAAVLRAVNASWTPEQVKSRLLSTADRSIPGGLSVAGRVNLAQAISGTAPAVTATARASVLSGRLTYFADPGGTNEVSITGSGTTYTIEDRGANLSPTASGCTSVTPQRLTCTGVTSATLSLGDRSDSVLASTVSIPVAVNAGAGAAYVLTGSANDTVTTGEGNDRVKSGAGDDTVTTNAGGDTVLGEDGNDTITTGDGVDGIDAGNGADTISAGDGANTVVAGLGGDTVTSGSGADQIDGGDGDDNVTSSGAGNDLVLGGPGADILRGGDGDDNLKADAIGSSSITLPSTNDQLFGEAGNDVLTDNGGGADAFDGGDGDDQLVARTSRNGTENFVGGPGRDLVSYSYYKRSVRVEIGTAANGSPGEQDSVGADVEDLQGGRADDVLIGSDAANWIDGGRGADTIQALGGDDLIDQRDDGYYDDDMSGGTGTDRVWYLRTDRVVASLDGLANDGNPERSEKDFIRSDVEGLEGGNGDDTLTGNASANVLAGGLGNDTLTGGGGTDVYAGGLLSTRFVDDLTTTYETKPCVTCADGSADRVSYADKTTAVTAKLDGLAGDGVAGENEDIPADVEGLIGGTAPDDLRASSTGSTLEGGAGADTLVGGPAKDTVLASDGVADTISCGGDVDSVRRDGSDAPAADCETVDASPAAAISSGVASGGATNDATPDFTFTAAGAPTATYECKLEAGATAGTGAFSTCGASWSPANAVVDGTWTLSVRAKAGTAIGPVLTRTFKVDTVARNTAFLDRPLAVSADAEAYFEPAVPAGSGNATAEEWQECKLDTGAWRRCGALVYLTSLATGQHTFQARTVDLAGNLDATPVSYTWTVDPSVLDTQIFLGDEDGAYGQTDTAYNYRATPIDSSFECSYPTPTSPWVPCGEPSESGTAAIIIRAQGEGLVTFRVRAKTPGGLVDPTPEQRTVTFDQTRPDTTIGAVPVAGSTVDGAPAVSFSSNEPAQRFECRLDSGAWSTCVSGAPVSGLTAGPHTYEVRAVDRAGNIDDTPASRSFQYVETLTTADAVSTSFTPTPANLDWIHWGSSSSATTIIRRNTSAAWFGGGVSPVGGGALVPLSSTPVYSWTDAAGTASGNSTWGAANGGADGRQVIFSVLPKDLTTRTLRIYAGVRGVATTGTIDVAYGAGARTPTAATITGTSNTTIVNKVLTFRFQATSTASPLVFAIRQSAGGTNASSAVVLYGATVN